MKQLLLVLLVSFVSFQATAQENDSIIVLQSKAGRLSRLIDIQDMVNEGNNLWDKEFKGHWSGIEFGINGFAHSNYDFNDYNGIQFLKNDLLLSNVLNLNLLQYSIGFQQNRNTIGLVTGLGLSIQSYRLDNHTSIILDESRNVHPQYLNFDSNQKSKLSSVYLEVPLLVEFQIPVRNKANRFYISAGITGAKRLETHTKVKYKKEGKKEKLKSPSDYSMLDYKVAGTIRIGYRAVNLFGTYDLVPLFEDRRGPVIYPFSAGIRLISF